MPAMRSIMFWPVVLTACSLISACDQSEQPLPSNVSVLATVNGAPITDLDVALASERSSGHGAGDVAPDDNRMLDTLILQEVARQKAVAASYDADTNYQDELYRLEAQVAAFARQRLSKLYFEKELDRLSKISDTTVQQYFEQNADMFDSEYHVWQIFRRDRRLIEEDMRELDRGDSFEQVAGKRFPDLPQLKRKPWDLGYVKWVQMPDAWWSPIRDLDIGSTSRIIEGPNQRYWIIKVVDRRSDSSVRFEDVSDKIRQILRDRNLAEFQSQLNEQLRAGAEIVYAQDKPDPSP